MEATITARKQTAFRLNESLLEDLKKCAAQCNRSLNNYVESLLAQALYGTPNPDTAEAIKESRAGKYAGKLDMKDFDAFLHSIDEIKWKRSFDSDAIYVERVGSHAELFGKKKG